MFLSNFCPEEILTLTELVKRHKKKLYYFLVFAEMKRLVILGSTGSIGRRALDLVRDFSDRLKICGLSTHQNIELLEKQLLEFKPEVVAISGARLTPKIKEIGEKYRIKVYVGGEALSQLIAHCEADVALIATVGAAGLIPTLKAIERGINIALANKEVLVIGGELVLKQAKENRVSIIPVDSEHSAILQCLAGKDPELISRIILTASGGPLQDLTYEELTKVKVEDALAHPTWSMGKKITVDSATLINKGFEAIECHQLFGIEVEKIEVVIHRQSIIHSMVEFVDGSVLAQLSVPDMYLPIQLALSWPERWENKFPRLNFYQRQAFTFEQPDLEKFPCLKYAYESARIGGTMPAVLNAANEIAVQRFLRKEIPFLAIPKVIKSVLGKHLVRQKPDLAEILRADTWARQEAAKYAP